MATTPRSRICAELAASRLAARHRTSTSVSRALSSPATDASVSVSSITASPRSAPVLRRRDAEGVEMGLPHVVPVAALLDVEQQNRAAHKGGSASRRDAVRQEAHCREDR
ncbi:hypothetical protein [Streptomyces sp. NBC_01320]|uniref:hypothetical protein n=1 Tax=Streptomyces sp. NBC_01320 TaxID=2903824 RepID=UPI002E15541D|nr:hypothetical protein OG395_24380 [Streptomyces sp. NBC_01320]